MDDFRSPGTRTQISPLKFQNLLVDGLGMDRYSYDRTAATLKVAELDADRLLLYIRKSGIYDASRAYLIRKISPQPSASRLNKLLKQLEDEGRVTKHVVKVRQRNPSGMGMSKRWSTIHVYEAV